MLIGFSWYDYLDHHGLVLQYGYRNVFAEGAVAYEDLEWEVTTFWDELLGEEVESRSPLYMRDAVQLEQEIQRHFDISTEQLRTSLLFVSERNAYRFNMSGIGGGPGFELVGAEFSSAENLLVLILEADYGPADFGHSEFHEINVNRLSVRLRQVGTGTEWILPVSGEFMFIGNESTRILRHPETGEEMPSPYAAPQPEAPEVIYLPDEDDRVYVDFIPGDGATLFVPDWEGIVRRAQEIDAFLEQYMTRQWIEQELGVRPVRVYSESGGLPFYRYDLMTEPGYVSPSMFKEDIDFYGLLAGRVGIIVLVTYDDNGGARTFEAWHPTAYGAVRHHPGAWGGQGWENRQAIAWHRIFPEPPSSARTAEITQRADQLSDFLRPGL